MVRRTWTLAPSKSISCQRRANNSLCLICLEAAKPYAEAGSITTNGMRLQTLARTYAEFQQKSPFLKAIEQAEEAATNIQPERDTTNNQFTLVGVLQEKGQGHTLLGDPHVALELYRESERIQPFRPIRDLGVLTILKAQANVYDGNIDKGVSLALRRLTLAKEYHSKRYISRIQRMYDRLLVTPLARHPRLLDLQEALPNTAPESPCDSSMGMKGAFLIWGQGKRGNTCGFSALDSRCLDAVY